MKTIKIILQIGQYIADVISSISANKIYLKILPGIRATSKELDEDRHSIILEPNVPVIRGKKKSKYSKGKFFGIYEGINTDDVIDYMLNDKVKYKKIMVTPESFYKVKQAANELKINIYDEYFLLFDECDRTAKDVAFRKKIILPMEDFFKFKNKAFISATAMIPSDPRFLDEGFEHVIIEPDYDYRKDIEVIVSNNVSLSLKGVIELRDKRVCVFLNSIEAITTIIEDLNIKDQCNIYCSKEKMYPLKASGYKVFDNITDDFEDVNFFTSRFNSAVDILMEKDVIVILATNLNIASHTMIDPRSEAIQIVGRFRNGVDKIYAITNIDQNLHCRNRDEALSFLEGCEQSYNTIKTLHDSTAIEGAKATLAEALELVTYSKFVNEDGSKNYFMVDNFLYEESVKSIFQSKEAFKQAYCNNYFDPTFYQEQYHVTDENYKSKGGVSIRELTAIVTNTINKVLANRYEFQIDNRDIVMAELEKSFPLIYKAYMVLGEDELLKNSWSKKQIKEAVRKKIENDDKRNFSFIEDLNDAFEDGYAGATASIKTTLKTLINKHELHLKPEIKLLNEYFHLSSRTTIKQKPEVKGYRILAARFNRKKDTK